jgi:tRNA threonylcarbamoyladenosine biosynthesis protein TsaB
VDIVTSRPCKVIGNGAAKFENLSPKLKASFDSEVYPSASDMSQLAWEKFQQHKVEDIAYFEPYYLKDFQTTPAKK